MRVQSFLKKKFLKRLIIHYFKTLPPETVSREQKEVIRYLSSNKLTVFPYSFTKKYKPADIQLFKDKKHHLLYTMYHGKRLYYKDGVSIKKAQRYFNSIFMEQDMDSPHRYLTKDFDIQENDILMVRDGTYLIGTCAIVTSLDKKIVYQSHIYKIRSNNLEKIHPFLLLAVLTSPIVKEQIFSKRFTQDIIDTLGGRIHELVLPIPKNDKAKKDIIENVKAVIGHKNAARELARNTILSVASVGEDEEGNEFLTMSN